MSNHSRRGGLPIWFAVLAGIPLVALGWLGWRLLVQEGALEQQRQRERLEEAASAMAEDLNRALAAWEEQLPAVASGAPVSLARDLVALAFNDAGMQRHLGPPLSYFPMVPVPPEAPVGLFAEAETDEFRRADFAKAEAGYRRLAASADRSVRAAALARLARTLRKAERPNEALVVYGDLAMLGETAVAGAPSELVARRELLAIHAQMGETAAAAQEAAALAALLAGGRYRIDRATFDFYSESIASSAPVAGATTLARGVDEVWARLADQPEGRLAIVTGSVPVVAVWRRTPTMAAAIVGRADVLVRDAGVLRRQDLRMSLEDSSGVGVLGTLPVDRPNTARTSRETGLPWTLRVASVETVAGETITSKRTDLLIGGFALMALVVASASYAVFRAVNQELVVARLQTEFVATVSHEFRTPLTAMRHLTEMLEDGNAAEERVPHYYRALGKETRRLQALVESLLDFGRMEAGRRTYQMEETSAIEIARQVVEDFADPLTLARVEWIAPPAGSAAPTGAIRADRDALSLALRNLVDNALKYSPGSASVRISVQSDAQSTRIAVTDQGPGVPRSEQRDIFRKFVRGTAAALLNIKGTGIGLAIADHIVRDHGGHLKVDSEPGQGSCFTIVLPPRARRA